MGGAESVETPIVRRRKRGEKLMVVHISGSPGSGKTTLGNRIKKKLNKRGVRVVDTDELITRDTLGGKELIVLEQEPDDTHYVKRWREIFAEEINRTIMKYEKDHYSLVLVFVGILNHWGGPKGNTAEMPEANLKLFLDVPMTTLLKQTYQRYNVEMKDDEEFWRDVAAGRDVIPDSTHIISMATQEREWHDEHGYKFVTAVDAYQIVLEMIE